MCSTCIAVSAGGGNVIGTRGFEGQGLAISQFTTATLPNYAGYVII